jgi:hypothetical protein
MINDKLSQADLQRHQFELDLNSNRDKNKQLILDQQDVKDENRQLKDKMSQIQLRCDELSSQLASMNSKIQIVEQQGRISEQNKEQIQADYDKVYQKLMNSQELVEKLKVDSVMVNEQLGSKSEIEKRLLVKEAANEKEIQQL